jgi:hypothetical protein
LSARRDSPGAAGHLFLHENARRIFLLKCPFHCFCFNAPFLFSSWKIHRSTGNEDETEDKDAHLTNLKQDQLAEVNAGIEDVDDCFPPSTKSLRRSNWTTPMNVLCEQKKPKEQLTKFVATCS